MSSRANIVAESAALLSSVKALEKERNDLKSEITAADARVDEQKKQASLISAIMKRNELPSLDETEQRLSELQAELAANKQRQEELRQQTQELQAQIDYSIAIRGKRAQYEKLLTDIEEYNNSVDEIADLKQADYYEKQLTKLYSALEGIEKEVDNVRKELLKLDADSKAFFNNVNTYFLSVKKATPEMEKVKLEIQTKAKEVMLAQKEIEKTIEPELVAKYKKAKDISKFPHMVAFDEPTSSCRGCGLELSRDIAAKLRQEGGLEFCPNCNRLVYKQ